MSVFRMPAGSVLLTGEEIELARYAVEVTQRARTRNGLPNSRRLGLLYEALAGCGQTDSAEEAGEQAEAQVQGMTVTEAAELLRVSARTVRRLAPRLGGRRIGGRWVLDPLAVTEHVEGQTA